MEYKSKYIKIKGKRVMCVTCCSTKNNSTTQQTTQSTPSSSTELSSVTHVSPWKKLSRDHTDQSELPGQTWSKEGRTDPQQMHGRDSNVSKQCQNMIVKIKKNILTSYEKLTVSLQLQCQLVVCSKRAEPQPQRLGCRLLSIITMFCQPVAAKSANIEQCKVLQWPEMLTYIWN